MKILAMHICHLPYYYAHVLTFLRGAVDSCGSGQKVTMSPHVNCPCVIVLCLLVTTHTIMLVLVGVLLSCAALPSDSNAQETPRVSGSVLSHS